MAILGVVLIVLGIAGQFFSHLSWTQTKPVVKAGPLAINAQEDDTVWIPTRRAGSAAGVVSALVGIGLVFAGKRSA